MDPTLATPEIDVTARLRTPRPFALLASVAAWGWLGAATACSSPTDTEVLLEELDRAEALWLETRPVTYQAVESRVCECLTAMTGPVLLEISILPSMMSSMSGSVVEEIVGATYVLGGQDVPDETLAFFLTVTELFELVRRAAAEGADSIEVMYDPDRGYPRRVDIDWDSVIADEEIGYRLEVVEPGS